MVIYSATNQLDGKVYVGKTQSLNERKRSHFGDACRGSSFYFHRALQKHGIGNFDWQVIDQAETEQELNEKEKYWIKFYKSFDPQFGYNLTMGGDGVVPNEETRQKMRANHKGMKGKNHSNEMRFEMSKTRIGKGNPMYGHHLSEEKKKNLSVKNLGTRNPFYGKHHNIDAKEKNRQAHLGRIVSEETKRKISMSMKAKRGL